MFCNFSKCLIAVGFVFAFSQADAKPVILASIKPLALIAQEVAGDSAEVEMLLPINASPHDYPLKVSDHVRLRKADVVLWVGPELESFLAKPLANVAAQKILSAYSIPGIHWPQVDDNHQHDHGLHQHHGKDPHLWLDPRNAIIIAHTLALKLGELNPQLASQYRSNANTFARAVLALDDAIKDELIPVRGIGFAVYHEGYAHFVARYHLHQLAYVTYMPERRPGAKHLQEFNDQLAKEGKCLFLEPYYDVAAMKNTANNLNLRIGLLDPIGNEQVVSYAALLRNLSQSFLACLADRTRS